MTQEAAAGEALKSLEWLMRKEPAAADEARACLRKLAALLQSQVVAVMNLKLIRVTHSITSLALQTRRRVPGVAATQQYANRGQTATPAPCTDTLHGDAQLPAQARVRGSFACTLPAAWCCRFRALRTHLLVSFLPCMCSGEAVTRSRNALVDVLCIRCQQKLCFVYSAGRMRRCATRW